MVKHTKDISFNLSYIFSTKSTRISFYFIIISLVCFQSVYGQYLGRRLLDDDPVTIEPYTGEQVNCTYTSKKELDCSDGETFIVAESDSGWRVAFDVFMSIFLVLFAGLMSGLTMGLMSLDITNLKIIAKSGSTTQRKHAKKIMPLVRKHHLLLVTLLCANALAMEALPLFLDRLVGPVFAILLSVTLVLLFGEIIPQAVCTRYGLAIGAYLSPLVWVLIILFFPIGYPLSKLLDCLLGHGSGTFYRRAELKELVGIHETTGDSDDEGEERLTQDEVNIIKGAIDLRNKTVFSAMTPIERVSMLEFEDKLDVKCCERLVQEGHSRWPVYRGNKNNIIGMILVKSLILVDPKDETKVKELQLRRMPVVNENMPLYQMLDLFQQGKSHMAVVIDSEDCITSKGIITLEDVVEELIGEEIVDETDVFEDVAKQIRVVRAFKNELKRTESEISIDGEPDERDPLLSIN